MAAQTHNLVVKTGQYTTMEGQEKNRWQKIGSVFKHDDGGTSIKIDCMPVGVPGWEGWVSVFPVEQQQPQHSQQSQQYAQQNQRQAPKQQRTNTAPRVDFDDDVPF